MNSVLLFEIEIRSSEQKYQKSATSNVQEISDSPIFDPQSHFEYVQTLRVIFLEMGNDFSDKNDHNQLTVSFLSQFFICLRSQVLLDSIFRFLSSSNFSRCRILLCSDPILSFMKSTSSMSDSSVSGVSLSDSIKRFSEINLDSKSQMPLERFSIDL